MIIYDLDGKIGISIFMKGLEIVWDEMKFLTYLQF